MSPSPGVSGASSIVATIRKLPSGSGATTTRPAGEKHSGDFAPAERPVHADVRQHEGFAVGFTLELDHRRTANNASHPIGADNEACADHFLTGRRIQAHSHMVRFLADFGGRLAALYASAQRLEARRQDGFRRRLGDHQDLPERRRQRVKPDLQQDLIMVANCEAVEGEAVGFKFANDAKALEHLERVGMHDRGPGSVQACRQSVDDQVIDARLLERDGERQSGRAGPNNQYVRR